MEALETGASEMVDDGKEESQKVFTRGHRRADDDEVGEEEELENVDEEDFNDEEEEEDEEEEDEEQGDEEDDEENDYEAQRQRNIARNQEMLRQLGLLAPGSVGAVTPTTPSSSAASLGEAASSSVLLSLQSSALNLMQTPKRKYKPRAKRTADTPTRTSSRLQTKSRRSYAENSFFKSLSPEEQKLVQLKEDEMLEEEKSARQKAREKAAADEEERNGTNNNKWIGSRLYDSQRGITCHQCRQKTVDEKTTCANEFKIHTPARHHYCRRCLWNRYGEALDEVRKDPTWICPGCRGLCNCSFCRKRRGQAPTGILDSAVLQQYSSVAEYLQKDRNERPAVTEEELQQMKQEIEKEVKEGIRPSAPLSNSNMAEGLNEGLKDDHYYVEAIVEHRTTETGTMEYFIKWLGYGYESNTWEPAAHLNCPHLIKEYHIRKGLSLAGKRGRKKKVTTQPNAPTEGKENGREEDEDGEEEEEVKEWETRRPGRPKGRARGRPRLVLGTGRGPRRTSEESNGAVAAKDQRSDELEKHAQDDGEKVEKEAGSTSKTKHRAQTKRKAQAVERDETETKTKTKKDSKQRMAKRAKKETANTEANKPKGKRTGGKAKEATATKVKPSNTPRRSPRVKQAAAPLTVAHAAGSRKSPRLADRRAGDSREEEDQHDAVADEDKPRKDKKRPRSETNGEQRVTTPRSGRGASKVSDQEEQEASEESVPKTLYWDEPVDKRKRRRSAPILLSENLIIQGNGQVRGSQAHEEPAPRTKSSLPKASTPKKGPVPTNNKNKKNEIGAETKRKTRSSSQSETRADSREDMDSKKKTKKEQTNKADRQEKKSSWQSKATTTSKVAARQAEVQKPIKKKNRKTQAEDDEREQEEQGHEGEEPSSRPLYWETEVTGKRKREPNASYLTDFLLDDFLRSSRKIATGSKKATKKKRTK